jgi:hypothetical protein
MIRLQIINELEEYVEAIEDFTDLHDLELVMLKITGNNTVNIVVNDKHSDFIFMEEGATSISDCYEALTQDYALYQIS